MFIYVILSHGFIYEALKEALGTQYREQHRQEPWSSILVWENKQINTFINMAIPYGDECFEESKHKYGRKLWGQGLL